MPDCPAGLDEASRGKLHIACFGRLTLSMDGSYVALGNKKAGELIAYLLCTMGRPVLKVRLAERLWPEAQPKNAISSLYKVCRHLRKFRQGDCTIPLVERRGELRLDLTGVSCDTLLFEALYAGRHSIENCMQAVELYTGPLFGEECYEWIAPYEAYYDARYIEMVQLLADHFTAGQNAALADYYKSMLD